MNNSICTATTLPELLVPAGNKEKLKSALLYGADAVYLGGDALNLRAACKGFSKEELSWAVQEVNRHQASLYYCLNSLPYQQHLQNLPEEIEKAAECGIHAFIVADPGVIRLVKKYAPSVPIHLSTQANTTNSEAIAFWEDYGVCRVNLAREMNYQDILAVRKACPTMELESFIHGAMCLAVSGQCLMSNWLNNRPANLGRCTQPCRFEYKAKETRFFSEESEQTYPELIVEERKRPDQSLWRVYEEETYSSIWAPDDLCLLPYLPWFVAQKITSLKIEGRTKSSGYVAHVADAYKTALIAAADYVANSTASSSESPDDFCQAFKYAPYLSELLSISSRPLSSGFFLPDNRRNLTEEAQNEIETRPVLARILEPAPTGWLIELHRNWESDQPIELMLPGMKRPVLSPNHYGLENLYGQRLDKINCGMQCVLQIEHPDITPGMFIRMPKK